MLPACPDTRPLRVTGFPTPAHEGPVAQPSRALRACRWAVRPPGTGVRIRQRVLGVFQLLLQPADGVFQVRSALWALSATRSASARVCAASWMAGAGVRVRPARAGLARGRPAPGPPAGLSPGRAGPFWRFFGRCAAGGSERGVRSARRHRHRHRRPPPGRSRIRQAARLGQLALPDSRRHLRVGQARAERAGHLLRRRVRWIMVRPAASRACRASWPSSFRQTGDSSRSLPPSSALSAARSSWPSRPSRATASGSAQGQLVEQNHAEVSLAHADGPGATSWRRRPADLGEERVVELGGIGGVQLVGGRLHPVIVGHTDIVPRPRRS